MVRRYSPENPSPAAESLTKYIQDKGFDINSTQVAAVMALHREWQIGHAEETRRERESTREQREQEKAAKAKEREEKKAERERVKAEREAEKAKKAEEREAKKAEKEARKAEKEAELNGDDSDSAPAAEPRRRLRTREDNKEAVGVSQGSF